MRFVIGLVGVIACQSSPAPMPKGATPTIAIEGYGVQIVPAPTTSATILENGALIFGPRAGAPLPAKVKNAMAKPGKPPTSALVPHADGRLTVYSDGGTDTTRIATGVGMATFDGVLEEVSLSPRTGTWTIVSDGKEQAWSPGVRLDVGDDGHSFKLAEFEDK
jgi:hypothetical protein